MTNIETAKLFFNSQPNETECFVCDGQVWNVKDKDSAGFHLAKLEKRLTKVTIQEVNNFVEPEKKKETKNKSSK